MIAVGMLAEVGLNENKMVPGIRFLLGCPRKCERVGM